MTEKTTLPSTSSDSALVGRDAAAPMIISGLLTKKPQVSDDLFVRYYRDCHGLIAARIPGIHQYWQHFLDPPLRDALPVPAGIQGECPAADRFQAVSEVTFRSETDRAGLAGSRASDLLARDEQNVFSRTLIYRTLAGGSRTWVDRRPTPAPQGRQPILKLLVFLRQRADVAPEEFRRAIVDEVAPSFSTSTHALRLRTHLLEPYDETGWPAPNVVHAVPAESRYQAWFEIGAADALEMARLFRSSECAAAGAALARVVSALHVFPEREIYTLVDEGRITLVGQRGYPIARAIEEAGALSQVDGGPAELIYR